MFAMASGGQHVDDSCTSFGSSIIPYPPWLQRHPHVALLPPPHVQEVRAVLPQLQLSKADWAGGLRSKEELPVLCRAAPQAWSANNGAVDPELKTAVMSTHELLIRRTPAAMASSQSKITGRGSCIVRVFTKSPAPPFLTLGRTRYWASAPQKTSRPSLEETY